MSPKNQQLFIRSRTNGEHKNPEIRTTSFLLCMDYLILVEYQSDAERKRIDYAVEKWQGKADVSKPRGAVIEFRNGDIDSFLDNLYSRLPDGKSAVRVFEGKDYSPEISEKTYILKYETDAEPKAAESFLNYLMNRTGASFDGIRSGIKCYTAYTTKGQVMIDIAIEKKEKTGNRTETARSENEAFSAGAGTSGTVTSVRITVRGYGEVAQFICSRIDKEMTAFLDM